MVLLWKQYNGLILMVFQVEINLTVFIYEGDVDYLVWDLRENFVDF